MTELDAVIFDIGNVLVRWDPRNLYRDHFECAEEMEYFLENIVTPAWNLEQDRGRLFADAVAELAAKYPEYKDKISLFHSDWEQMLGGEIEGSVQILKELLAAGLPVYAITNFSAETWPIFCARHSFPDLFHDIVVSGQEKLIKPDVAIYELAIDRFEIQPERAIFIDDSLDNVEGAKALKIKGHHFTGAPELRADLQSYGLLI